MSMAAVLVLDDGWVWRRNVTAHVEPQTVMHEVILVDVDGHPVEVWCPIVQDWPAVTATGGVVRCAGCELLIAVEPPVRCGVLVEVDAMADGVAGELQTMALRSTNVGLLSSIDRSRR